MGMQILSALRSARLLAGVLGVGVLAYSAG